MLTTVQCALHIAISIGTCISIVGRSALNHVSSALLVLVIRSIMGASTILFPLAKTINRLGAALSGALLVAISVSTSITIVRHTGGDLVGSAPLVNVILGVVTAGAIRKPNSLAVHWLTASLRNALTRSIREGASLSIECCLCYDFIGSTFLVVVSNILKGSSVQDQFFIRKIQYLIVETRIEAFTIGGPQTVTIHRLAAATLRALNFLVSKRTCKAIKLGIHINIVHAASLVGMIFTFIFTSIICTPRANTVHWLRATIVGALLKRIRVGTGKTIVGRCNRDLIQSASLVLVGILVMDTGCILIPSANTVHWLRATILCALHIAISIGTSKTIVGRCNRDLIQSASLVLVGILVMNTGCILIPRANAVNRLRASDLCALHIAISIGTSISVVGRWTLNHVSSALLVLVIRSIMGTSAILFPVAKTINRLGATLSGALLVSIGIEASKTIVRHTGGDLVGSALLVDVVLCVILTVGVLCPVSDTIHRLAASKFCAFLFLMLVRASLSVQISFNSHNIVSAFRIVVAVLDV